MTDKTIFDHFSDWFKILLKSGVPALLIGLGFVLVFVCSMWLGSSWMTNAGFWFGEGTGVMMIILGARIYWKELEVSPRESDSS